MLRMAIVGDLGDSPSRWYAPKAYPALALYVLDSVYFHGQPLRRGAGVVGLPQIVRINRLPTVHQLEPIPVHRWIVMGKRQQPTVQSADDLHPPALRCHRGRSWGAKATGGISAGPPPLPIWHDQEDIIQRLCGLTN